MQFGSQNGKDHFGRVHKIAMIFLQQAIYATYTIQQTSLRQKDDTPHNLYWYLQIPEEALCG